MGMDIITQKRWVKVGNRYLTMIEHGSKNWTETTYGLNGRNYERMLRSWTFLFGNFAKPLLTEEEIYAEANEWIKKNSQYAYFRYCGKDIGARELFSFIRSGIRHALSLEDMQQEDLYQRLHYLAIESHFYQKNKLLEIKPHGLAATTSELEQAIQDAHAEAQRIKLKYPDAENYFSIDFHPDDPVKRLKKHCPKKEMPVYWVLQLGTQNTEYSFFAKLSSAHYWKGSLLTARRFREKEAKAYVEKYGERLPKPITIRKVVNGVLQ